MTYDDPFFLEVLRCFDQLRSLLTDWSRAKSGGRSRGARMGFVQGCQAMGLQKLMDMGQLTRFLLIFPLTAYT